MQGHRAAHGEAISDGHEQRHAPFDKGKEGTRERTEGHSTAWELSRLQPSVSRCKDGVNLMMQLWFQREQFGDRALDQSHSGSSESLSVLQPFRLSVAICKLGGRAGDPEAPSFFSPGPLMHNDRIPEAFGPGQRMLVTTTKR